MLLIRKRKSTLSSSAQPLNNTDRIVIMGKSDLSTLAIEEFSSLEKMLLQTADDAVNCLKLLKTKLSDYDSRHSNYFTHTAVSVMRSDMRTAKDTAVELKRAAYDIKKSFQPSVSEIHAAQNIMSATAKAMDHLNTLARNYDQKKGRLMGIKGAVNTVEGHIEKKNHEREGMVFSKSDRKENKESLFERLFGKSDKNKHTGLFGKSEKEKGRHHGNLVGIGSTESYHDNTDCNALNDSDTLELLVKSTLRENFNLSALSHQITITEKSLTSSPSFMERAKEAVGDVKEKLKGENSGPTSKDQSGRKHARTP